jgi:hypothetical protein
MAFLCVYQVRTKSCSGQGDLRKGRPHWLVCKHFWDCFKGIELFKLVFMVEEGQGALPAAMNTKMNDSAGVQQISARTIRFSAEFHF